MRNNDYADYGTNWQERSRLFADTAPFTHLYTSPLQTALLVENDEDRAFLLNMIALTGSQIRADLLAFAIMSNHLHLIIQGTVTTAQMLFDSLLRKTVRYYSARDNAKEIASVTCGYTEITSLRQFENEVVYVIRNPFVVNDSVHLFAYPWCSGYLYFNPLPDILARYKEMGGELITIGSDAHVPEKIAGRFEETAEILQSLGFRYYAVYSDRKPQMLPL